MKCVCRCILAAVLRSKRLSKDRASELTKHRASGRWRRPWPPAMSPRGRPPRRAARTSSTPGCRACAGATARRHRRRTQARAVRLARSAAHNHARNHARLLSAPAQDGQTQGRTAATFHASWVARSAVDHDMNVECRSPARERCAGSLCSVHARGVAAGMTEPVARRPRQQRSGVARIRYVETGMSQRGISLRYACARWSRSQEAPVLAHRSARRSAPPSASPRRDGHPQMRALRPTCGPARRARAA